MNDIIQDTTVDLERELDRLAEQYRAAGGLGVNLLNILGGQAEGLIDRLPSPVRAGLDEATERGLTLALQAASASRKAVGDQPPWMNTMVTTTMGALGGFGGLPSALLEMPATITVLMRSIQGVAAEHGFDPKAESTRFDCIEVFSAAGPLARDDGADLGLLSVRMTLTGPTLRRLIATVAPKLAVVLGQKLATQTVPVLGALAGASVNYTYTRYYQQMAHVHFGLRRVAINADLPLDVVLEKLKHRLS